RLLALAALLGALLHVRVLGVRLTSRAALGAGLGTGLADQVGERPLARHDARRRRTMRGTVLTGAKGLQVLFLALGDHPGAVGRAGIARPLAVRTLPGTLVERLSVVVVVGVASLPGQGQRGREHSKTQGGAHHSHGITLLEQGHTTNGTGPLAPSSKSSDC